ncbi:MAG: DUF2461 domain-containing protein [Cryomorphaceae bacterium]|jgi:uncharacterized protein (TIGR02453 family)|nr:DUF2461 domain-containing protein [Cryomorphaceae bacterium]
MQAIPKSTINFLKELKLNNNREWFNENKQEYQSIQIDVKKFTQEVKDELNTSDNIDELKIFRIYRDLRFSKDKTPYKTNIGMAFHRKKPEFRGGYYLEISAEDSFIAAGFWNPNKEDLLRIRREIELDGQEFKRIINQEKIKDFWGEIKGDELKTSPKGFDSDHHHIDMIKKKQFIFIKKLKEKEILDPSFQKKLVACFTSIRPFFDYMSEILTTNLNGESTI